MKTTASNCGRLLTLAAAILSTFASAAHFEQYAGELWTQSTGFSGNTTESDPVDNPATPERETTTVLSSGAAFAQTSVATSVSTASGSSEGRRDVAIMVTALNKTIMCCFTTSYNCYTESL